MLSGVVVSAKMQESSSFIDTGKVKITTTPYAFTHFEVYYLAVDGMCRVAPGGELPFLIKKERLVIYNAELEGFESFAKFRKVHPKVFASFGREDFIRYEKAESNPYTEDDGEDDGEDSDEDEDETSDQQEFCKTADMWMRCNRRQDFLQICAALEHHLRDASKSVNKAYIKKLGGEFARTNEEGEDLTREFELRTDEGGMPFVCLYVLFIEEEESTTTFSNWKTAVTTQLSKLSEHLVSSAYPPSIVTVPAKYGAGARKSGVKTTLHWMSIANLALILLAKLEPLKPTLLSTQMRILQKIMHTGTFDKNCVSVYAAEYDKRGFPLKRDLPVLPSITLCAPVISCTPAVSGPSACLALPAPQAVAPEDVSASPLPPADAAPDAAPAAVPASRKRKDKQDPSHKQKKSKKGSSVSVPATVPATVPAIAVPALGELKLQGILERIQAVKNQLAENKPADMQK